MSVQGEYLFSSFWWCLYLNLLQHIYPLKVLLDISATISNTLRVQNGLIRYNLSTFDIVKVLLLFYSFRNMNFPLGDYCCAGINISHAPFLSNQTALLLCQLIFYNKIRHKSTQYIIMYVHLYVMNVLGYQLTRNMLPTHTSPHGSSKKHY